MSLLLLAKSVEAIVIAVNRATVLPIHWHDPETSLTATTATAAATLHRLTPGPRLIQLQLLVLLLGWQSAVLPRLVVLDVVLCLVQD